VDYFNVKTHDIWEENVTTTRGVLIKNITSLGFWDRKRRSDIKEGDTTEVGGVYLPLT